MEVCLLFPEVPWVSEIMMSDDASSRNTLDMPLGVTACFTSDLNVQDPWVMAPHSPNSIVSRAI
jgi:hypothetical protein